MALDDFLHPLILDHHACLGALATWTSKVLWTPKEDLKHTLNGALLRANSPNLAQFSTVRMGQVHWTPESGAMQ